MSRKWFTAITWSTAAVALAASAVAQQRPAPPQDASDSTARQEAVDFDFRVSESTENGRRVVRIARVDAHGRTLAARIYRFGRNGDIVRIISTDDDIVSDYAYEDATHRLTRVQTVSGSDLVRDIEYSYNARGDRAARIDHMARQQTWYHYSGDDNVIPDPLDLPDGVLVGISAMATDGDYRYPDGRWEAPYLWNATFRYDDRLRLTSVAIEDRVPLTDWVWVYELRLSYSGDSLIPVRVDWQRRPVGDEEAPADLLRTEVIDSTDSNVQIVATILHPAISLIFTPQGAVFAGISDALTPARRLDRSTARFEPEHGFLPSEAEAVFPERVLPRAVPLCINLFAAPSNDPSTHPPTGEDTAPPASAPVFKKCGTNTLDYDPIHVGDPDTNQYLYWDTAGAHYRGFVIAAKHWPVATSGTCSPGRTLTLNRTLTVEVQKKLHGSFGIESYFSLSSGITENTTESVSVGFEGQCHRCNFEGRVYQSCVANMHRLDLGVGLFYQPQVSGGWGPQGVVTASYATGVTNTLEYCDCCDCCLAAP